jgi:hypothetical protein
MAGKIIADQIQSTTAGTLDTKYVVNGSAKAWAFFTQAFGGTQVLNGSFNISSLTDSGLGETTFVPTNAFADGNNNVISATTGSGENNRFVTFNFPRTTVIKIEVYRISDNSAQDAGEVSTTVHGDLA